MIIRTSKLRGLSCFEKRRLILRHLEGITLPVRVKEAFGVFVALNPDCGVSYKRWQREVMRLACLDRLDVEVVNRGVRIRYTTILRVKA